MIYARRLYAKIRCGDAAHRPQWIIPLVFNACLIMLLVGCSWNIAEGVSDHGDELQFAEESNPAPADDLAEEEEVPSKSNEMIAAEEAVLSLVGDYGEKVAVAVVPLDGSEGFSINGDTRFVSASMIKLLILAEYMDEIDAGTLHADDTYTRSYEDIVGGAGVIQNATAGTVYSYDDLARCMIMYSDNVAANVLIDLMGFDNINAEAKDLGLSKTSLQRKMMDLDSGVENYITANDAASILAGIAEHTLASKATCERAESFLLQQTDLEGLAQGLPDGVDFGHKTGSLDAIRHDGGIVYAENPYVIVVLTNIGATASNSLMASISSEIYECLG